MKRDISVSDVLRSLVLWFSGTVAMVFFASLAIIFGFFDKTGNLNEYVDITSATSFFKTFLRIRPKIYAEYDLLTEQGILRLMSGG